MFNGCKYKYWLYKQREFYQNITKRTTNKRKVNDKIYMLKLNRRISNLIIRAVAFTIRCMWYYRVEDISVWEYFDKEDFDRTYNDLRYLVLYLNYKNESIYKNYSSLTCRVVKRKHKTKDRKK